MLTYDRVAVFCAFDLIEVDTTTCVRCRRATERRPREASGHPLKGIAFNQHYRLRGVSIFKHAYALGGWEIIPRPKSPGGADENGDSLSKKVARSTSPRNA
jgi:hypothetical protein